MGGNQQLPEAIANRDRAREREDGLGDAVDQEEHRRLYRDDVHDTGQEADRHRGSGDPLHELLRAAHARLLRRRLRRAEADGDHPARLGPEREAPAPVRNALLEHTGAVGALERKRVQRPRLPERLGRHARAARDDRHPRRLRGRELCGLVRSLDAVLERGDEHPGHRLRPGVAEEARDGVPRDHGAVDGQGDTVDAVPGSAAELLVLVLEAGAVRRLLRLRGRPAGEHPLRRRALLAGLPGLHGGRRERGRTGRAEEVLDAL